MPSREATNTTLASRFAAVRVHPAHRDTARSEPWQQEWFLLKWPKGEVEPIEYRFATLAADTPVAGLVTEVKRRWRIERDYRELKQEIGLGHYKSRGWRGFHHHATLCIAAYGFGPSNPHEHRSASVIRRLRPRGSTDPP